MRKLLNICAAKYKLILNDLHASLIKSRDGLKILKWQVVFFKNILGLVLCPQRIIGYKVLPTIGPIWKFMMTIAYFTIQMSERWLASWKWKRERVRRSNIVQVVSQTKYQSDHLIRSSKWAVDGVDLTPMTKTRDRPNHIFLFHRNGFFI